MYTGDIVDVNHWGNQDQSSLPDLLEIVMTVNKPLHCKLEANLPNNTNPAFGCENYMNKSLSDCETPQYRNGFENISLQKWMLFLCVFHYFQPINGLKYNFDWLKMKVKHNQATLS